MPNATRATLDAVLKQLYVRGPVDATYRRFPLLSAIPKFEGFMGRNLPVPIKYGNGTPGSATFPNARGNASYSRYEDFLITPNTEYAVANITGLAIASARSDKGAFVRGMKSEVDSAFNTVSQALDSALFGEGYGVLGVVGAIAGTDITLADTSAIHNFEVGQVLVSAATPGGAIGAGTSTVTAVNRIAGTVTVDAIASIGVGDYLFREGDAANGGSKVKLMGLQGWLPANAPTGGDSFFSVDRSVDSRLYGTYTDQSGAASTETAIINGVSLCAEMGGNPDLLVINPRNFRELVSELGAKVNYNKLEPKTGSAGKATFSFQTVQIWGDTGLVDIISDRFCPIDHAFALETSMWKLNSMGKLVDFAKEDGLTWERQADADAYSARVRSYMQLSCAFPGANTHILLP